MKQAKTTTQQFLLKLLVDFWGALTLIVFWLDFLTNNQFDLSAGAMGIIYIGILSIYTGSKEFDRWQSHRESKYKGEIFVVLWTVSIIIMAISAVFTHNGLRVPEETVAIYTAILTIFAISQKSKSMFHNKNRIKGSTK